MHMFSYSALGGHGLLEFFLELFTGASKLGRTQKKKRVGAENERF
jgi:hypothetical protein